MRASAISMLILVGCRLRFEESDPTAACNPGDELDYVAPAPPASAYWVATDGSDLASGTSRATAWATFDHAMSSIGPGATLVIADGTYAAPLRVTVSGMPGMPITIRAETDGGAIIDGGGAAIACQLQAISTRLADVIVEGIQCRNSNADVVRTVSADRVTLRRVTAYGAAAGEDLFYVTDSNDVLVEDCAGAGDAHSAFVVYTSTRVRIRRAWAYVIPSVVNPYHSLFSLGSTSDSIIENGVGWMDPIATDTDYGVDINVPMGSFGGDRNLIIGNVLRDVGAWGLTINSSNKRLDDNHFVDTIVLGGKGGVFHRADANLIVERMSLVDNSAWTCWSTNPNTDAKDADFTLAARFSSSILMGCPIGVNVSTSAVPTTVATLNNVYHAVPQHLDGVAVPGVGDRDADPMFDTAQFGVGGYLLGSTTLGAAPDGNAYGARVMFRVVDGAITDEPLWPWPMEKRIRRETGRSVTWEEAGGLWKTLCDAYAEP